MYNDIHRQQTINWGIGSLDRDFLTKVPAKYKIINLFLTFFARLALSLSANNKQITHYDEENPTVLHGSCHEPVGSPS